MAQVTNQQLKEAELNANFKQPCNMQASIMQNLFNWL